MKRLINHVILWNKWRKHSGDSTFHKILVLLKIIDSPSFFVLRVDNEVRRAIDTMVGITGAWARALNQASINDINEMESKND